MSNLNILGAYSSSRIIDVSRLSHLAGEGTPVLPTSPFLSSGVSGASNSNVGVSGASNSKNSWLADSLASSYDLSTNPSWPSVKDQGDYGTCVSVTLGNALQWITHGSNASSAMYIHFNTNFRMLGKPVYKFEEHAASNSIIQKISKVSVDSATNMELAPAVVGSGAPSTVATQSNVAVRFNDDFMYGGVPIVAALSSINAFGYIDSSIEPYPQTLVDPLYFTSTIVPTLGEYNIGANVANSQPYTLLQSLYDGQGLIDAVKFSISVLNTPVIMAWMVYNNSAYNALYTSPSGYIHLPSAGDVPWGGHCSMLVGYDDKTSEFTLMNTWGTSNLGEHKLGLSNIGLSNQPGYFKIDYAYIEHPQICEELWVMTDTWQFQPEPLLAYGSHGFTPAAPTYILNTIANPLIVGVVQSSIFDQIDLTEIFMNATTFRATSTVHNVSVVNGNVLVIYHSTPWRTEIYTVTVVALNLWGRCVKSFEVSEGYRSRNIAVLKDASVELALQYQDLTGISFPTEVINRPSQDPIIDPPKYVYYINNESINSRHQHS